MVNNIGINQFDHHCVKSTNSCPRRDGLIFLTKILRQFAIDRLTTILNCKYIIVSEPVTR